MKKYIYIFAAVFSLAMYSCDTIDYQGEYSKDGAYGEKNQVYFYKSNDTDTLNYYSFGSQPLSLKKQTVNVLVYMAGMPQNKDLKFRVVVDDKETTAKSGIHYTPIKNEYHIPANKTSFNIPVELIRDNMKADDSNSLKIVLKLEPTDDLGTSFTVYNKRTVEFDNFLAEPSWWVYYTTFFGPYSRNKYLKLLEYYDSNEQKVVEAFTEFNGLMLNFQKVYKFFKDNPDYNEVFPDESSMLIPYQ